MIKKLKFSAVNLLVAVFTATGFGGGYSSAFAAPSNSDVSAKQRCEPGVGGMTQEECDCAAALKANSISALESFLNKHPLGQTPSACGALAYNALTGFTTTGGSRGQDRPPVGDGRYGG